MADSKDHGVATQTSGYRRGSAKDIEEKQRAGKGADLDLPTYDRDAERHGSEAVNLSGVHDNTHRKLKARHIQLIGFVDLFFSVRRDWTDTKMAELAAPLARHYMSRSDAVFSMAGQRVCSLLSRCGALSFWL